MQNTTSSVSEILTNTKLNTNSVSVNKINTKTLNTKHSVTDVRNIAEKLAIRLNNPTRFNFYCKVAWLLPENLIWSYLEQSERGNNPQQYFSWLCTRKIAGKI